MRKKKVIYTCITGEYDELYNHQFVHSEWDYVCFSDSVKRTNDNSSWKIVPLLYSKLDNTRNNRWHKINSHIVVGKYEHSVYVDANIDIKSPKFFDHIEKNIFSKSKFAPMLHLERDCVYEEAVACINLKKDTPKVINEQVRIYKKEGYPPHNGLYANGILYRMHKDPEVVKIMDDWWQWVENHSKRDQLSLPYVLWRHEFKPGILPFAYQDYALDEFFVWPHAQDFRNHLKGIYERLHESDVKNTKLQNVLSMTQAELDSIKRSQTWKFRSRIRKVLHLNE